MRREWSTEELIGSWTLVDEDWRLVGNKSGATRLGFVLLVKFFEIEARFPRPTSAARRQMIKEIRALTCGFAERP